MFTDSKVIKLPVTEEGLHGGEARSEVERYVYYQVCRGGYGAALFRTSYTEEAMRTRRVLRVVFCDEKRV